MRKSGRFRGRVRDGIFISYRHDETAYLAEWLFVRLTEHIGSDRIFKDVNSIIAGEDYPERIKQAVASCEVLLALIGRQWLTITDGNGKRRLEDPKDWVRLEIEAALMRKIRVIPILADMARMPRADELPASLANLAYRHAFELNSSRLKYDTNQLLNVLNIIPAGLQTAQQPAHASSPIFVQEASQPSEKKTIDSPGERGSTDFRVEVLSRSYCEIFFRLYSGSMQHFITFTRDKGNDLISVDESLVKQQARQPYIRILFTITDKGKKIPVIIMGAPGRGRAVRDVIFFPGKLGPIRILVDNVLVYEELRCRTRDNVQGVIVAVPGDVIAGSTPPGACGRRRDQLRPSRPEQVRRCRIHCPVRLSGIENHRYERFSIPVKHGRAAGRTFRRNLPAPGDGPGQVPAVRAPARQSLVAECLRCR